MINLLLLLSLAVFALLGYKRGFLKMVCSLGALLVASILGNLTSGLGGKMVSSQVPGLLQPLVGTLLMGLIWFVIADFLLGRVVKREMDLREDRGEPRIPRWEAITGGVMGAGWGVLFLTVVLAGVSAIGRAQRVVRVSNAEVQYRAQHPGPWVEVSLKELPLMPAEVAETWAGMVEESMLATVVDRVNPLNDQVERTLTDLSVVVNDPGLMVIFMGHPKVQQMMNHPKLQELAQNPEVNGLLQSQDYRALMDHPAILKLARDREIQRELKGFAIDQVLADIRKSSQSLPTERDYPRARRR